MAAVMELMQGYLDYKKTPPPPRDRHRAIGIGLVQGPGVDRFLMREACLYVM